MRAPHAAATILLVTKRTAKRKATMPQPPGSGPAGTVMPGAPTVAAAAQSPLVQYVVVRSDLMWPTGALVAQGCHASTAAMHLFRDVPATQEYLADLDRMHKIVLAAPSLESLRLLSKTLAENEVEHKLWVEQPEDIPTCLASRPYRRDEIRSFFRHLKLFK